MSVTPPPGRARKINQHWILFAENGLGATKSRGSIEDKKLRWLGGSERWGRIQQGGAGCTWDGVTDRDSRDRPVWPTAITKGIERAPRPYQRA